MDVVPISENELSALISAAKSDNVAEQEKTVTRIRKLLTHYNYMSVEAVVRSGSIPVLVECMNSSK